MIEDNRLSPLLIGIALVMVMLSIFTIVGPIIVEATDDTGNQKISELNDKIYVILNNPNISCQQIQDLRQQSVQAKHWYEDPLFNSTSDSKARDLWVVKNCGSNWGWFDK